MGVYTDMVRVIPSYSEGMTLLSRAGICNFPTWKGTIFSKKTSVQKKLPEWADVFGAVSTPTGTTYFSTEPSSQPLLEGVHSLPPPSRVLEFEI
jgi:hypothetical protein